MTERKREAYIRKEITEYISKDGCVFDTEEECIAWENKLNIIDSEFQKIETNAAAEGFMNIDGCEHCDDAKYDWYFPKNKHEIEILAQYYGDKEAFRYCEPGSWICVEDNGESTWITTLNDGIEYAASLLARFGYEVTIKKI